MGDQSAAVGAVVVWAGAPSEALDRALGAHDLQVVSTSAGELADLAAQLAPDLVVLDGEAASDAEGWARRLGRQSASASAPIVVLYSREVGSREVEERPRSRFGVVARFDRGSDPEVLASKIASTLSSLLRRAPRWRASVAANRLGAVVARFVQRERTGLLVEERSGRAIALAAGGSAPDTAELSGHLPDSQLSFLFHERPKGRIGILDARQRSDVTPRPLEDARVLVAIDGERGKRIVRALSEALAEARAVPPVRPKLESARVMDPSVVVVDASDLASGALSVLWDDARLSTSSLLVLVGDGPTSTLVAAVGDLAASETGLRRRLSRGEAFAERLETLGAARWLKALARREGSVALEVASPAGLARVELTSGKLRSASLTMAGETSPLEGRAAVEALLSLPFGRVRVGPAEAIDSVGPRLHAPVRKGLIAAELVGSHRDVTEERLAPTNDGSQVSLMPAEGSWRPSAVELSDLAEDLDATTGSYDRIDFAKLRAAARREPEPAPEPEPARDAAAPSEAPAAIEPEPVAVPTESRPPPEPVVYPPVGPQSAPPPEPVTPFPASTPGSTPTASTPTASTPTAASRPGAVWLVAAGAIAIAAGVYGAWRLTPEPTAPITSVARRPAPEPAPAPEAPPAEPSPAPLAPTPAPTQTPPPSSMPAPDQRVADLLARSVAAGQARQYYRAESLARQAVELDPDDPRTAYRLAVALLRLRRNTEAMSWAERAERGNPDDALVITLQGDIHASVGRFSQAEQEYLRALRLDPGCGPAQRHLERVRTRSSTARNLDQDDPEPSEPAAPRERPAPAPAEAEAGARLSPPAPSEEQRQEE